MSDHRDTETQRGTQRRKRRGAEAQRCRAADPPENRKKRKEIDAELDAWIRLSSLSLRVGGLFDFLVSWCLCGLSPGG
jgi:macrodomain Ter protein organizer (MatP/YcbG family)